MTEHEIKEALNDINSRSWEALIQVIDDHVYNLEKYLDPSISVNHGVLANWAGQIYAARDISSQLQDIRIKE